MEQHAREMPAGLESLSKFDSLDFLPFFAKLAGDHIVADGVMDLFKRALPIVFWYHLFAGSLAKWQEGGNRKPVGGLEPVLQRI